ncbi:uncharacterized protein Dana_GF21678, isoform E [Drosophila ananassae]|uniref:Uncharacterized protein, isoform D n=1 Tax=Drosophila ananassae TaxID=7217 RepID=A0A0P8Y672_DROAN|nr:uncharacterized protein Dana_GF21678, isoform D [Drosophila ananassae]KPU74694.1 uncharacterized protein Dana_GF21678, isoform E [Drosophila ananassae]
MCTLPTTSRSPRKTASCDGPTPLPTPVHLLSGTSLVSTLGEQFSPNAANNDLISQSVLSRTTTNAESAPAAQINAKNKSKRKIGRARKSIEKFKKGCSEDLPAEGSSRWRSGTGPAVIEKKATSDHLPVYAELS